MSLETAVAAASDVFDWLTPCVSPPSPMTTVTDPFEALVCTETALPDEVGFSGVSSAAGAPAVGVPVSVTTSLLLLSLALSDPGPGVEAVGADGSAAADTPSVLSVLLACGPAISIVIDTNGVLSTGTVSVRGSLTEEATPELPLADEATSDPETPGTSSARALVAQANKAPTTKMLASPTRRSAMVLSEASGRRVTTAAERVAGPFPVPPAPTSQLRAGMHPSPVWPSRALARTGVLRQPLRTPLAADLITIAHPSATFKVQRGNEAVYGPACDFPIKPLDQACSVVNHDRRTGDDRAREPLDILVGDADAAV